MKFRAVISAAATMVLAAGCANLNSIYHHRELQTATVPNASLTSIDARQRVVLTSTNSEGQFGICAEPPPDVFAVISASLAAKVDAKPGAEGAAAAAELATVMRENASTIQRSQTLNLLSQSMYRTCERYMAGRMTDADMTLQSLRDHRAMVAILAIE